MATHLFVRTRVSNYETWKKQFESLADVRREHGWEHSTVYRDPEDPAVVIVLSRIKDAAKARQFYASPELLDGMVMGGVHGAPELRFLDIRDEYDY